jgi:hypothetical protein
VEDIDLSGQAADVAIELAVLEGKQAADVTERKQLVLSAFTAPSWIYAEPINKFNRYNTEYDVTVKPYFNYDYDDYFDDEEDEDYEDDYYDPVYNDYGNDDDYEDEDETEESEFAGQLVNFDFTDEFSKDETEDEQEYNDEDYLVNRYSKPNQEVREAPIELDDFLKQLTASGIDFKLINLSDLQKEAPEPKKLTTEQLKQKLFDNLSPEERKLVDALASDIKNVMSQFKPR